ncbi:MAG TPA: hypothetical protein PLV21_03430 [Cyclobacteriaceae bacterium]|nr:hypothetical protein [Cyclobacteriaceae bacterium]HRJ80910.1 hypothetical protein [Cyclobacteriaceae bacterium]
MRSTSRSKSTPKIPALKNILQSGTILVEPEQKETIQPLTNQPYTFERLQEVWMEFADKRKKYRAEYQLLTQQIDLRESTVLVHLHNPVQETLLNDLKSDLMQYIRESLNNYTIQISGELKSNDSKKVIYTNREKFEHLAEKNPNLILLKDRLGLDPDF